MATRFYLPSSGTPPINCGSFTGWTTSTNAVELPTYTTKQNTVPANAAFAYSGTSGRWIAHYRYISPPLAASATFTSGTDDWGFSMCMKESSTSANFYSSIWVRIWDSALNSFKDNSTTYMAWSGEGTELTTTAHNQTKVDFATDNTYTANIGDRIVIELGVQAYSTSSYTLTTYNGDNSATDLSGNTDTDTTRNAWVQANQQTLSFLTEPTRFYLPSTGYTPAISPAYDTDWESEMTGGMYRQYMSTTKKSTALTTYDSIVASGAGNHVIWRQYISDQQLAAQDISGTFSGVFKCMQSSAYTTLGCFGVRVLKSDGTLRGVLRTIAGDGATNSFNTSLDSRYYDGYSTGGPTTLTLVHAEAGDWLCVEIGETDWTGNTKYIQFGDASASDLPYVDGATSAYNPWVQFSQKIVFYSGVTLPPNQLMMMGCGI